jgi:hypothetical protein
MAVSLFAVGFARDDNSIAWKIIDGTPGAVE